MFCTGVKSRGAGGGDRGGRAEDHGYPAVASEEEVHDSPAAAPLGPACATPLPPPLPILQQPIIVVHTTCPVGKALACCSCSSMTAPWNGCLIAGLH